ncbi:MAG: hypothetical protein JWR72_2914 [Flavisolibacter sp.]|jgi:hypothetical protein|nr:hypothetical protein [Flavisolibacter sp.]
MADNFYLTLAAILFLPVIPAYILYKFLPASDTDVSGPYQGLSIKLKGAFAGYFLLVIVGLVLQYAVMNNKQEKQIETLTREGKQKDTTIAQQQLQLQASANPVIDWHIKGAVTPGGREGTRFFYDDGTTTNSPDGSFELIKRSIAKEGTAKPPKWMCIYNATAGFKVVSLNRDISHPDIAGYNIAFDDTKHEILVRKPIDINSIEKDSLVAVANFIESNPALKQQALQISPGLFEKADVIKQEQQLNKVKLIRFNQLQRKAQR